MSTEARLERLEMELAASKRRYRRLGILVLGLAAAGVALAWTEGEALSGSAQEVVRAQSFVLEAEDGSVRGLFTLTDSGSRIALGDPDGAVRTQLATTDNGPQLIFSDATGQMLAALGQIGQQSTLRMYDFAGELRLGLSVAEEILGMSAHDASGQTRLQLAVTEGGPALDLLDASGQMRTVLGVGSSTTPEGRTTNYPESSIRLVGPDGELIWSAP